jgi:hypothetical protein
LLVVGSILLAGGAVFPALADPEDDPEYGSVYGRVRHLEGGLTLLRAGEGTESEGIVNDPVTPGDRLTTEDGRAEIGLADGSVLWLDQGTRLDVRNLADIDNEYEKTNLLALEGGAIRIETSDPDSRDKTFRIDTEAGSVYLLSGGSYRIENEDGATTVYSFRGVAELSGDEDSVLVRTGERSSVQPGRLPSEPRRFNTARLDDFDRFVEDRQEAYLRRGGERYPQETVEDLPYEVRPYASELSFYGSWHNVPSYGWVWRPVYTGGWGPYVNGYWSWCRGGWVWVSYDPWGWAPYHYGRWDFAVDIGWVWIPGSVWSGAWVSFAVGPSYVGWCPLNYYNRPVFSDVTIINSVNINVTRLKPRGWRFVTADRFADRRPGRTFVRADRLPRGTDVVLTSRLPRFDPKDVGRRPEEGERLMEKVRNSRTPLPAAVDRESRPVSFRTMERDKEPRSRRGNISPREQAGMRDRDRSQEQAKPRGQGNPREQARPRPGQGQSADRPARPDQDTRPPAPRPGPSTRPPRRSTEPDRVREPRQAPPSRQGAQTPDRGRGPSENQARPRRESPPPAGTREAPRRDSGQPDSGRSASRSDQKIERLFDGVRSDRNRGRPEPQRIEPPRGQPQRVQLQRPQPPRIGPPAPTRQGMEGPRPEQRPNPRPSAPPRAPKPPKDDNDKGHNGEDHRH